MNEPEPLPVVVAAFARYVALFALVCALAVWALGCGNATETKVIGGVTVVGEPICALARDQLGNPINFGDSLAGDQADQDACVAAINSAETAHPSLAYMGLTFYVFHYPITFDGVVQTAWGPATTATSVYDPSTRSIYLSWLLAGGPTATGHFSVGDAPYELANARCNCESALLPNPPP